jgi:hypothetical protein
LKNAEEGFPNYSKMEQPVGKERVQGKGMELTLCLGIDILWSMGNLMPELALTSIKGLGI